MAAFKIHFLLLTFEPTGESPLSKITAYDDLAPTSSLLPAPVGLAGTGAKQNDGDCSIWIRTLPPVGRGLRLTDVSG